MKKEYFYPVWLRMWHWLNAIIFLVLIVSGISLHYSASSELFMPFETAITAHNVAGLLLTIAYTYYLMALFSTNAYRSYIIETKGIISNLFKQAKYYISGIFNKEPHPFHTNPENRFNPLQKITYVSIMFILMPLIIISGLFLLFPDFAPDKVFGVGGITPMAIIHSAAGFFLSLFMIGHIYLATTGTKWISNFKSMVTGWHEHDEENLNTNKSEV